MPFPRVTGVRHLTNYELELTFSDGKVARLDFRDKIVGRGGVFRSLQDVASFAQVSIDHEAGTLVWPSGVDFCPNVLYAEATGTSIQSLGNELEVA